MNNKNNMLSAAKVRIHGMTSAKWTTKDKITQYKGLIRLYTRDKKIMEMDTIIEHKKQTKELKTLQKQIESDRKILDTAIRGDKQRLRNKLSEHREMLLAYQNEQCHKVNDMVNQVNFTKRKSRDMLNYRMEQKSEKLIELKLRAALYEDRIKYEGMSWQNMLPCERAAHLITGKVQDALLKKEAAMYIKNSYKEMIAIMNKDALYFDAILASIRNDGINQGKCMINATRLGQLGTEYLDDRRQEYECLERIVKKDMASRREDLKFARKNVENFASNIRYLLRKDSDINLGKVELEETPSFVTLQDDLKTIETTLTYLKNAIFTPTIESIYPCLQEQVRQRERLGEFVAKCEDDRDKLSKKVKHASTLRTELENTMVETTYQYKARKEELLENIAAENAREKEHNKLVMKRYDILANVRISLGQLQLLARLLASGKDMPKEL
ncbi:hypothetical protein NQ317_001561 [Molorchus minor]|uniref:Uncharacterized protein n=1 Tax=Molorchus minor TaxID=1323400 RepID=A0ABQ9J656_9CUCU|nr:hypothetical protein NQ317_001561 [Molorchus minor]